MNNDYNKRYRNNKRDNTSFNNQRENREVNESTNEQKVEKSPAFVKGYANVNKDAMLNVRKEPTKESDIVTTIRPNEEVKIDIKRSTSDWFRIRTKNGVEGFCMREYVVEN